MVTNRCPREEAGCIPPVVSETTFATFLPTPRHECGGTSLHLTCQTQLSTTLRDRRLRFLVISRGPTAEWTIHVFFDPLFLNCHTIGNDLPVDHDERGSVQLNRTCGHSTSAWCQPGNGLGIVNGGSGQWKRLRSRMGHALDDDDTILETLA